MRNKYIFFFSLSFLVTVTHFNAFAAPPVHIFYTVSFPLPQTHELAVEMNITGISQPQTLLKMPVWAPGSYLIREFSRNIELLSAGHNQHKIQVTKVAKNEWSIATKGIHAITVKYTVYAFERSVQGSFVDISHAFLSTPGIFIYPSGLLSAASRVRIIPYKNWTRVSTSLTRVKGDSATFCAPDYNALFDSPFEIGNQDLVGFKVGQTDYQLAIYGSGNYDKVKMINDLTKVIKKQTAVFGDNPNRRYLFILHNYQTLTGDGLEHLKSSVVELSRDMYSDSALYHIFLNVMAHEHFHLWNGKRLRPIALGPFNYDQENYSNDLWIVEGFTRYYENATVNRTKLFSIADYLHELAQNISYVVNQSGLKYESLADASFDSWIKLYRHNENSDNSTINYYNQGALVAMLLDLEIIHDSQGRQSLDDVMHYLYGLYYKKLNRGYTDREFKTAVEKFTRKILSKFYDDYVYGTTPIDVDYYLNFAGYRLVDDDSCTNKPWIGAYTESSNGKLKITELVRNSSFFLAGLNVNDIITAIDNSGTQDLPEFMKNKKPDDTVEVKVLRDGLTMTFKVRLFRRPYVRYHIESLENPSPVQLVTRAKWLN